MTQLFKNFARSTLAGSITNVATSLTVQPGDADKFPVVAGSDFFLAGIVDASGNAELVKCTARSGGSNTLTVTRAQEGTTALSFAAGSFIFHGPTAADIENCLNGVFAALSIAGTFHAGQRAYTSPLAVAFAAALVLDAELSNVFEVAEMTASITSMTINNAVAGHTFIVSVKQGGAGTYTVAPPAGAKVSGVVATGVGRVTNGYFRYCARDARWEITWVPVAA